jgi:hypothetical protein
VALTVTAVTVPFPAGVVAATLAGTLQGVALAAGVSAPRAELQVLFALDQATPANYVPAVDPATGRPINLPVGSGDFVAFPQNIIPPLAKIQVALTNYGGANVNVDLITS